MQQVEGHNIQSPLLAALKDNRRSHAIGMGLKPTGSTDAPMIARLKTRELKLGHWCAQVIALGLAVAQK